MDSVGTFGDLLERALMLGEISMGGFGRRESSAHSWEVCRATTK
jgi:hypothetical protein